MDRSATFDFLLAFHRNHGPICSVSGTGDFSRKSQTFPTVGVHNDPTELGIEDRFLESKNWNDGATRPRKKFDHIFGHLYTIHERHIWTDRRAYGHRPTAKTALTDSVAR